MLWKSKITRRAFVTTLWSFGTLDYTFAKPTLQLNHQSLSHFFSKEFKEDDDPLFLLLNDLNDASERLLKSVEVNYRLAESVLIRVTGVVNEYVSAASFSQFWNATHTIEDELYPSLFDSFLSINLETADRFFESTKNENFTIVQGQINVNVTVLRQEVIRPSLESLHHTATIEKAVVVDLDSVRETLKLVLLVDIHYEAGNVMISNLGSPKFYDRDNNLYDPFADIPAIQRTSVRREFISSLRSSLGTTPVNLPALRNADFDANFSPRYHVIRNERFYILSKYLVDKKKRSLSINNLTANNFPLTYFLHHDLFQWMLNNYISKKLDEHQRIRKTALVCRPNQASLNLTINHSESRTIFLWWDVDVEANINLDYYLKITSNGTSTVNLNAYMYAASYSYSIEDCPVWKLKEASNELKRNVQQKIQQNQSFFSSFNFSNLNFSEIKGILIPEGITFNFKK